MLPEIHEKLKPLRKKHGYSQEEVAEALHMSQNNYSLIETGKTKLDIERLFSIAAFYKISVYELLEISTPPPQKKHTKIKMIKTFF